MIPGCSEYAKTTINNHLLYIYRIYEYDDDDEVSICHLIMCMINTTYNKQHTNRNTELAQSFTDHLAILQN